MTDPKRIVFTADARLTFDAAAAARPGRIGTLRGYPITWNTLSDDRGGYRVRLLPGSVTFTPQVHALWHHDASRPLGDLASGTLRILPADAVGVPVEIDLPDTSYGRDALELVRTGRAKGMSFAMVWDPRPVTGTVEEGGTEVMVVSGFTCDEVTITPRPSFQAATVAVAKDPPAENSRPAGKGFAAERLKLETYRHRAYPRP